MKVLMVDVGGTSVKMMASGHEGYRKFPSGPEITGAEMVARVLEATSDWAFEAVSLGIPGRVVRGKPATDPLNLGGGWADFDFERAFGRPVRVVNDASMQALAHYQGGRMMYISLGTSIGATLIVDDTVVPMEVGLLRLSKSQGFADKLQKRMRDAQGHKWWEKNVWKAVHYLKDCFWPEYFVIGGGNAKTLEEVPPWCIIRDNQDAFKGAMRLWPGADMYAEDRGTSLRITRTESNEAAPTQTDLAAKRIEENPPAGEPTPSPLAAKPETKANGRQVKASKKKRKAAPARADR